MINLQAGIYTKSSVLMCSILVYATFIGLFGKEPLRAGEISAQPLCTRVKIDLWPSSKSDAISLKHLTCCNKLRPTICCICLRFTVRHAAGNKLDICVFSLVSFYNQMLHPCLSKPEAGIHPACT